MNDFDDIEVLDIFEKPKEKEVLVEEVTNSNSEKVEVVPRKKKKRVKVKAFQILFCSLSALFMLGCCVFYGSRLIKYYKIYNPKAENGSKVALLANHITDNSEVVYEGAGLYISAGNYIYKGDVSNNYIKYNNMLWRVVRVNSDGTMLIILDDYLNVLDWDLSNVDYSSSSIDSYLETVVLNALDTSLLVKNSYCVDEINELTNITCDNQNDNSYVTLLDVTNYLNSVVDGKTYLATDDEIFWLNNRSREKVWHTNGANVSLSAPNNFYEVRPVVKLKGTLPYLDGDGTIENPYLTSNDNELGIGSIVQLGDDKWVVYEKNDDIRLMSIDLIDKQYRFDKEAVTYSLNDGSLGEYLNTTYLDSLSYKDLLLETEWLIGNYSEGYQDISSSKIEAKVGIPNLLDIKLDSSVSDYFLSTSKEEAHVLLYGEVLKSSKVTVFRSIRPCIALRGDIKFSGSGTFKSPFVVEE